MKDLYELKSLRVSPFLRDSHIDRRHCFVIGNRMFWTCLRGFCVSGNNGCYVLIHEQKNSDRKDLQCGTFIVNSGRFELENIVQQNVSTKIRENLQLAFATVAAIVD